MTDDSKNAGVAPRRPGGNTRAEFYRQCRRWHGYLSAFAFIALMFFSATGIMLNHPEWFEGVPGEARRSVVTLSPERLATAMQGEDVPGSLAAAVAELADVIGVFSSGEVSEDTATLRLEGVRGSTDISVDLRGGQSEVEVVPASASSVLQELHRGTGAGAAWRLLLDVTAALVLGLSLVGYVLFFSLRFRLRTSLALTVGSLVSILAVFVALVP
ncbi:PepSY-associated TM helix domain-containing protein [Muricoccus vinaceus]|uniref:PepSY-associated TM helix domain-containing protein n=1 Tax=Muricoccus vinaceus TaxID=424704 RepID=A0ABV6IY55_9PROT